MFRRIAAVLVAFVFAGLATAAPAAASATPMSPQGHIYCC